MTELERYKAKLIRLQKRKSEEPDNTYRDWDKEIQHCKINIADAVMDKEIDWIPVTEGLPELGEPVLITAWDRAVTRGIWYGNKWGTDRRCSEDVIAWMPLPEPYRPVEVTSNWKQHVTDRFSKVN